jgi:hypothetical protein
VCVSEYTADKSCKVKETLVRFTIRNEILKVILISICRNRFGDVPNRSFRTAPFVPGPSPYRAPSVPLFLTKESHLNHEVVSLYVLMKDYTWIWTVVVVDMGSRREYLC